MRAARSLGGEKPDSLASAPSESERSLKSINSQRRKGNQQPARRHQSVESPKQRNPLASHNQQADDLPMPMLSVVDTTNDPSRQSNGGPSVTSTYLESLTTYSMPAGASTALTVVGADVSMAGMASTSNQSVSIVGLYDWNTTPLVTGPLYMIVNTVYVLSDCTITDHRLQVIPRDPKYPTVRIKIDNMIEFKMLNHLHYFDKYLLEIVSKGKVVKRPEGDRRATVAFSRSPNPSQLTSPVESDFEGSFRTDEPGPNTNISRAQSSKFAGLPSRSFTPTSSPLPSERTWSKVGRRGTEKPTSLGHPFHNRASVSPKGHEGGEGYSVVTLRALGGNRFFDFVEALEDVRDISELPHDFKPIVHPIESDLRVELPVYGQKYYSIA